MTKDRKLTLSESYETTLSINEQGYLSIKQAGSDAVLLSPNQVENLLRYYEKHENDMANRWDYGLVEE